jgi:hypothetical protein
MIHLRFGLGVWMYFRFSLRRLPDTGQDDVSYNSGSRSID